MVRLVISQEIAQQIQAILTHVHATNVAAVGTYPVIAVRAIAVEALVVTDVEKAATLQKIAHLRKRSATIVMELVMLEKIAQNRKKRPKIYATSATKTVTLPRIARQIMTYFVTVVRRKVTWLVIVHQKQNAIDVRNQGM